MAYEKILIVDDDIDIIEIISIYLHKEGFNYITAENGKEALILVEKEKPDLMILDVMLPDISGIELCEKIRKISKEPILFLSSKGEVEDRIAGLQIGGDDYIVKPFSPKELVARVKSNLRRNNQFSNSNKDVLIFDKLIIDLNKYRVSLCDNPISLSNVEFEILKFLAINPGRVFTMDEIYKNVWKEDSFGDNRTVMVHISNIRKKIEKDPTKPQYILTVRGVGYKFTD